MPQYFFFCCECDIVVRKLLSPEQAQEEILCSKGHVTKRQASGSSVQTKETLDNGIQTKALERLADAPRLADERRKAQNKE